MLFGADAPDLHAHAAHMAVDEVGGRDAVLTAPGSLALGKSNAVKGNITLQWIKVDTPGARLSVARCEIRPTDIHVLDILLGHPDTERDIADPLPGSPPPDHLNAARAATGALATDAEKLRTGPETTPPLARRGR
ncbi:hypothetical protein ACIGJO_29765 [Streptomyces sp. NPDC079020]|uniref:hypothetical protein n=1 Tax=Streptomyces sp. NPDC079020 TaxID=3365722 RepID=UPI0037D8D120